MQRDGIRALVALLLAVLAIGVAAATLTSAVDYSEAGFSTGDAGGSPGFSLPFDQDDQSNRTGVPAGEPASIPTPCIPFLLTDTFALLAVAGMAAVFGLASYRHDRLAGVLTVAALLLPGVLLHAFLTNCGTAGPGRPAVLPAFGNVSASNVSVGTGSGAGAASPTGLLVVLAVIGLVLVVAVFRATGNDDTGGPRPDPEPEPDEESLTAIGEAAGAAADRIEGDADVENEVYRAWREMTRHLDVPNPAASTPGEFAAAATDAGMASADVSELTDLFEAVRYGGVEPTADREERAVAALRRIEAAYGEDDP
ncbi:DUF4129 domain-containing protein [Halobacteriaceae archaeon GCM10025711]